jgi:hypothetical protein
MLGLSSDFRLNKLGMSIALHTMKESQLEKVFVPLAQNKIKNKLKPRQRNSKSSPKKCIFKSIPSIGGFNA